MSWVGRITCLSQKWHRIDPDHSTVSSIVASFWIHVHSLPVAGRGVMLGGETGVLREPGDAVLRLLFGCCCSNGLSISLSSEVDGDRGGRAVDGCAGTSAGIGIGGCEADGIADGTVDCCDGSEGWSGGNDGG